MKLLIIGGTEFLGRYLVHASLAQNHQVTLFNRGKTNPELFPDLEKLRGDRNGNLEALKGRQWDAVIDTCGFASCQVRATAGVLAPSVEHYTFISSISVYRDFSRPGLDESAPLEMLPAGMVEDETHDESYGERKVLREEAAEETMPGRVLSIRAGLIVGPHAGIDRFPYWVRRVARGGAVLAPGHPDSPLQMIDVRDLAEWIVRMVEARQTGIYNATGPDRKLTFVEMLEECRVATGSDARFTWVEDEYLIKNGVIPFSELPFWLPGNEYAGFFTIECARAFKAGLACRKLADTARDTVLWDRCRDVKTEPAKRATVEAEGQIGLLPRREVELLLAWNSTCNH